MSYHKVTVQPAESTLEPIVLTYDDRFLRIDGSDMTTGMIIMFDTNGIPIGVDGQPIMNHEVITAREYTAINMNFMSTYSGSLY